MNLILRTPIAADSHAYRANFWILCLTGTGDGRVTTDPERGPIEGRGFFREPDISWRRYQLEVDGSRYPDIVHVRPGDRLSLDDARVFEVAMVASGEGGHTRLELLRS